MRRLVAAWLASSALLAPVAAQEGVVAEARALAVNGKRAEALALLDTRLDAVPDDGDARTLRGIVRSWEGRYDEARADLAQVLLATPGHGDALPALINVELWSGHPARAEELAREGLELEERPQLLLLQARAHRAQQQDEPALAVLRRLLRLEPRHADGLALRESILAGRRHFVVRFDHASDLFDDERDPWHETSLQLKRETSRGSLLLRYSEARRFGERDGILEAEAYPSLRPGTYAYVGVGWAPESQLYPDYRIGFDVYQSLPGAVEASLGYRRLGFGDPVNIYTGLVGWYRGNWYYTVRSYVTPSVPGTSVSVHLSVRRYFGDGQEYVGLRYGHGRSREELRTLDDVALLNSDTLVAEWNRPFGRRFELLVRLGWSREERVERATLRRLSPQAGVGYRF